MVAFVATSGSPGWKLGRWTKISPTVWQEQKIDNPKSVYQFQVVNGPSVPGSTTVRLKMQNQNTEVLLLDSTIQVFSNAGYLGEFCGQWQGAESTSAAAAQATLPPAAPRGRNASAGGGYSTTPGPAAQPARQPQSQQLQQAGYSRTSSGLSEPRYEQRKAPTAPSFGGGMQFQNLDRSPEKVQKLCDAAKNGDIETLNRLLADGIDPDGTTRDGRTPLMAAAAAGNLRVIDLLLTARADPTKGKGSETPLTIAFQKGNQDILKKLFGASFNTLDSMVGSNTELATITSSSYSRGEVPERAADNLRDVTSNLAKTNRPVVAKERREVSLERNRGGNYSARQPAARFDMDGMEPDEMQTEALRTTMRTIAKQNNREL